MLHSGWVCWMHADPEGIMTGWPDVEEGVGGENAAPTIETDVPAADPPHSTEVEEPAPAEDAVPSWAVALGEGLAGVRAETASFRERARAQEDLIQRMQVRIEELQADQVRRLLGPVVVELAGLHASLAEASELDYERLGIGRVNKEFAFLADRLEGSLELLDVVSVEAEVGDSFDSRVHTASRRVPTADPSLDNTIATVQRQGFKFAHEAKTSIYARVTVYRYDPSAQTEPDPRRAVEDPATVDQPGIAAGHDQTTEPTQSLPTSADPNH